MYFFIQRLNKCVREFKTLEKLRRYIKLYENQAAGDEQQQVDDGTGEMPVDDGTGDPGMEQQPADGTEEMPDPTNADDNGAGAEEQANPEDGVFISDIKKAEFAKILISALMNETPKPGTVPDDMLNVTKENADQVIKYVQSLLNLDSSLSTENETDENGFTNAVKGI